MIKYGIGKVIDPTITELLGLRQASPEAETNYLVLFYIFWKDI